MIGSEIIHFKRVDSTSNYIATLLKESKIVNGLVILADEQTDGRGQRGAKWQSTPGENLLFSFFIEYGDLLIFEQQTITHATSLAISNCLTHFQIASSIKWPNDIVIGNKKIAGILIENQFQGNKIKSSIIGIGLNVLQQDFPIINTTSISNETSTSVSLKDVLNRMIFELNQTFSLIQLRSYKILSEKYTQKLWLLNEIADYETAEGIRFRGIIKGTNETGKLIIYREDSKKSVDFDLKEIRFIERNVQ
jgi:BirA family biotin operon repressor/biotin-[acetyl-CoA-carboxylase] ligase